MKKKKCLCTLVEQERERIIDYRLRSKIKKNKKIDRNERKNLHEKREQEVMRRRTRKECVIS